MNLAMFFYLAAGFCLIAFIFSLSTWLGMFVVFSVIASSLAWLFSAGETSDKYKKKLAPQPEASYSNKDEFIQNNIQAGVETDIAPRLNNASSQISAENGELEMENQSGHHEIPDEAPTDKRQSPGSIKSSYTRSLNPKAIKK